VIFVLFSFGVVPHSIWLHYLVVTMLCDSLLLKDVCRGCFRFCFQHFRLTNLFPGDIEGPESYYCPISGDLMTDPVIDHEGNTYERRSIEAWLVKQKTSPVTRSPLTLERLAPNRALKDAIDAWKQANQGKFAAKVVPKALQGSIAVDVKAFKRDGGLHDVIVTMDAGKGRQRSPVDVVCVIDISVRNAYWFFVITVFS
jgi:hypothetical protein